MRGIHNLIKLVLHLSSHGSETLCVEPGHLRGGGVGLGSGVTVDASGFGVYPYNRGLEFGIYRNPRGWGSGFRVQGLGFGVQGLWFWDHGKAAAGGWHRVRVSDVGFWE